MFDPRKVDDPSWMNGPPDEEDCREARNDWQCSACSEWQFEGTEGGTSETEIFCQDCWKEVNDAT